MPPTTLKPRPFLPPPFSKYTEWRLIERDFGLAITGVCWETERGLVTGGLLLTRLSTTQTGDIYSNGISFTDLQATERAGCCHSH